MDPLPPDHLDLPPDQIEERFRWARTRGHPTYLWPDIPLHLWRSALDAIEGVTRRLLEPGAAAVALEVPRDVVPEAVGVAAFTSGMGPLLGWHVERGTLEAEPPVARLLALHLLHGRRRADKVRATLLEATGTLAQAGIDVVGIKGIHTSYALFPEPGTRPLSDIDLVIPPRRFDDADLALRRAGHSPGPSSRRPLKRGYRPPGTPNVLRSLSLTHAEGPIQLDLHANLDRNFFGVRTLRFGFPAAGERAPWPVPGGAGDRPLPDVLAEPLLSAFLAAHASEGLHNLTLVRLVELVLSLRLGLAQGTLRWDDLLSRLEAVRATRFVHPAFELVERLAPGTLDPDFRAALAEQATPRMERVLAGMRPATAQRMEGLSLDERLMWAQGPVETLRRLVDMVWPSSAGNAPGERSRIYLERLFRLLRGRVTLRSAEEPPRRSERRPANGPAA